jgi:lipoprotein Spr
MKQSSQFILLIIVSFLFLTSCRIHKTSHSVKKTTSHNLRDLQINKDLKKEIDRWLGTPYKYGGNDHKGVDCSGFVNAIYQSVYNLPLPRSSKEMYAQCLKIKTTDLKEGDLVFFDYTGKGVSHVGIYLKDDKYAHASSSKGVVISTLSNEYTRKNYIGAGRFKK